MRPLVCLLALLASAVGCQPLPSQSITEAGRPAVSTLGETATAWEQLDIPLFTAPMDPTDGALLRGLKAYVDGDLAQADAALREALDTAPLDLTSFVRDRLADVAAERFDWAEVVRQREARGQPGGTVSGWARFPNA
ncbi:MAG: hypothetical protein AAGI52_18310, partial [Bacteroidota bacterium]